ncbi:MAG: ExeA family protein, partial [bacterium]
ILNPRLSPRQFLAATASELGVEQPRYHSNELHEQIHDRLLALKDEGRAALLIVDEAHLIPSRATFEEIRLLTNFQLDDQNLIAVVLVGQPELRTRLAHARYRALTQRMGASFHLTPLTEDDAAAYLAHRLEVAGGSAEKRLFTDDAARLLHRAARGIPRVLNHLATQALLEAMARERSTVDADTAEAAVAGQPFLEGPAPQRETRRTPSETVLSREG